MTAKSGAPYCSRFGSFVATIPLLSDSTKDLSAGRCVCSVALPAASACSICLRYSDVRGIASPEVKCAESKTRTPRQGQVLSTAKSCAARSAVVSGRGLCLIHVDTEVILSTTRADDITTDADDTALRLAAFDEHGGGAAGVARSARRVV